MNGRLPGPLHIAGSFSAESFTPPAGSITDAAIAAGANVDPAKLGQRERKTFAQAHGTAATAERRVIHRVRGATGTIEGFACGVTVAATGNSTVTIDLLKNGTTILTAATVLDSSNAAYTVEAAAGFASTALVAGDVLEVAVTVAAGTGSLPEGTFGDLDLTEDAQ